MSETNGDDKTNGEVRNDGKSSKQELHQERHKGSFDLDVIKNSELYQQRIEQPNAVKRKYAIALGYLGTNYQGLQINPDAHTIEAELEKALFLCGAVQESNFGYLQKITFSRAGRTDRGVHAVNQCCAMKLMTPVDVAISPRLPETNTDASANSPGTNVNVGSTAARDSFLSQLNQFLPPDIRALAINKVGKAFNAKNHCTKRWYHYTLPTYVLMPSTEVNALLATEYALQGPVSGAGYSGGFVEPTCARALGKEALQRVRVKIAGYRAPVETMQRLRQALQEYCGTHWMHNFTTGKHPDEASAQRYIVSFDCTDPVVDSSSSSGKENDTPAVEWVTLRVLGQSFLLHQIRKMVSLAIEVARGATLIGTIRDAFTNRRMDLPMAPSLGLYLDQLFFEGYDGKQRKEIANDLRLIAVRAKQQAQKSKRKPQQQQQQQQQQQSNQADGGGRAQEETAQEPSPKRLKTTTTTSTITSSTGAVEAVVDIPTAQSAPTTGEEVRNQAQQQQQQQQLPQHEEVAWTSTPSVVRASTSFREDMLTPHIHAQEASSLMFLYYLDYLRAYPHHYDLMTKPFGPPPASTTLSSSAAAASKNNPSAGSSISSSSSSSSSSAPTGSKRRNMDKQRRAGGDDEGMEEVVIDDTANDGD